MPNNPLFWIFSALLGYAALTLWAAHTLRAFRRHETPLVISLLALPLVTALVAAFAAPGARLLLAAILLLAGTLGLTRALAPRQPWVPDRESKLTLLHLVLLSG